MDWRVRMRRDELRLKRLVRALAALHGDDPEVRARRDQMLREMRGTIAQMRAFLQDCLSGRSSDEQSLMRYRVRVEFPLYSHLGALSAMSFDFSDWFSA